MSVDFRHKVGSMTVTQHGNDFNVSIWDGNCLAVFNNEYTDENGVDMIQLYALFLNEETCERIVEEYGGLFSDEVSNVKINLYYKSAFDIVKVMTKHGYNVMCYYEEPKNK